MAELKHKMPERFFEDEPRTLIVSKERKRVWAVLLDLLIEFDHVCKEHGIKYFLDSGTLLGAVRHKGFVPWDDDLDVIMLREEYDRLCEIAPKAFAHPYFFQTNETDPGSARGHAQLRNSETTGILKNEMQGGKPMFKFNQGLFLDVLVLDDLPDDQKELESFLKVLVKAKVRIYKMQCSLSAERSSWFAPSLYNLKLKIDATFMKLRKMLTGVDPLDAACRHLDALAQRYRGRGMKRCANVALNPRRPATQYFDKSIYQQSSEYEFEGLRFPGPADCESVLKGHYGDWRKHVVGDSSHGGVFVDVDNPYTEYID